MTLKFDQGHQTWYESVKPNEHHATLQQSHLNCPPKVQRTQKFIRSQNESIISLHKIHAKIKKALWTWLRPYNYVKVYAKSEVNYLGPYIKYMPRSRKHFVHDWVHGCNNYTKHELDLILTYWETIITIYLCSVTLKISSPEHMEVFFEDFTSDSSNHHCDCLLYCIDSCIYLHLSKSTQSAAGLKALKPAANERYLMCKSLPYYFHLLYHTFGIIRCYFFFQLWPLHPK